MNRTEFYQRAAELTAAGIPFAVATLIEATGSTPQDSGAKMLVTADGLAGGTVGGGRVEAKAIDEAQAMLVDRVESRLVDWNLKADVGMTCGGRVKIFFESVGVASWRVVVFGAGHVTQALARLLATLPCQLTCIDPRGEWLARLPEGVRTIETDDPPAEVDALPDDVYVLCMTRGHTSDLPVLERVFKAERDFAFLGVIGSDTKAAVLRKELVAAGAPPGRIAFRCPVGLPIGTNHPGEIAVSIAAQLLEVRDERRRVAAADG